MIIIWWFYQQIMVGSDQLVVASNKRRHIRNSSYLYWQICYVFVFSILISFWNGQKGQNQEQGVSNDTKISLLVVVYAAAACWMLLLCLLALLLTESEDLVRILIHLLFNQTHLSLFACWQLELATQLIITKAEEEDFWISGNNGQSNVPQVFSIFTNIALWAHGLIVGRAHPLLPTQEPQRSTTNAAWLIVSSLHAISHLQ